MRYHALPMLIAGNDPRVRQLRLDLPRTIARQVREPVTIPTLRGRRVVGHQMAYRVMSVFGPGAHRIRLMANGYKLVLRQQGYQEALRDDPKEVMQEMAERMGWEDVSQP